MKTVMTAILATAMFGFLTEAKATTVRASEMTASAWSRLQAGLSEDLTVEFRQGDQLPVTIVAEGDFLETPQVSPTYVNVRRNFWLRLRKDTLQASLDGTNFKPLNELVKGGLKVTGGADQNGGPVNAIQIILQADLK